MQAPLIRSFIVLGTPAAAGLTEVTVLLLRALTRLGVRAVGMKPVAHGLFTPSGSWHSDELQRLAAASALGLPARVLCAQLIDPGMTVDDPAPPTLEAMVDTFRVLATWADAVVVDGAEPLGYGALELARALALPFVFVVKLEPGCVDTAIAQATGLQQGGLECAGWLAWPAEPAHAESARWLCTLRERMPGAWLGPAAPALGLALSLALGRALGRALGVPAQDTCRVRPSQ